MDTVSSIKAVMQNLFEFQKSGYLCDTVVVVDDGELRAHSAVLAAASPVFKSAMTCGGTVQAHTVLLPGVTVFIAKAIIQFIYTGKATLCRNDFTSVSKVMKVYEELGISKLLHSDVDENGNTEVYAAKGETGIAVTGRKSPVLIEQNNVSCNSVIDLDYEVGNDVESHDDAPNLATADSSISLCSGMHEVACTTATEDRRSAVNSLVRNVTDLSELCELCGKVCASHSEYMMHRKEHRKTTRRKQLCDQCGKAFDDFSAHRENICTSTAERLFHCRECPAVFGVRSYLQRHMIVHTDERPFHCELCGKSFRRKRNLDSHHKVVHMRIKRYYCNIYFVTYGSQSLFYHETDHTGHMSVHLHFLNS